MDPAQSQANVVEEAEESFTIESQPHLSTPRTQIAFGSINDGFNIGINNGTINATFTSPKETTFFGSLAIQAHSKHSFCLTRTTLLNKARLQSGRRHQRTITSRSHYEPYVEVKSRAVKQRLIYLASRFQFLDRGFAEYFQTVVPSFDQDYVQQRLEEIRHEIARGQSSTPTGDQESDNIYLGDLGEFCERISHLWDYDPNNPNNGRPKEPMFNITHRRDQEIFEYLQDAFEVPYWELMLDIFLHWRANSISLSGDIVLRVLEGLEREIRTGRRQLISDINGQSEDTLEDLAPILEGIDARLKVLGTVCDMNEPLLLEMKDLVTASPSAIPISTEDTSLMGSPGPEKEKENVVLITLILLFLTAAIVPGYKAFSISMKSSTLGSIDDADFWYLIQSSIMSVLGSLTMVIPLMKKSWFSPAYSTMWMFFLLGMSFAIIAIVIYPLVNTGWSSMVAFFGSIASVASVLVMTQAAARDVSQKLKND